MVPVLQSQMARIVTAMYSNPSSHGIRVVHTVLEDLGLVEEWKDCIKTMCDRNVSARSGLRSRLESLATPGDWSHITTQTGMFSYTGLQDDQCLWLQTEMSVYLLPSVCVSVSGLNTYNLERVARAIHAAVLKFQSQ